MDWRASKQKTVTFYEAVLELLALSEAAKHIFEWRRLFDAIRFDPGQN